MTVDIVKAAKGYVLECAETGETLPGFYETEEDARVCGEEYSELYEFGRKREAVRKRLVHA